MKYAEITLRARCALLRTSQNSTHAELLFNKNLGIGSAVRARGSITVMGTGFVLLPPE
jgi:hypothetical protein